MIKRSEFMYWNLIERAMNKPNPVLAQMSSNFPAICKQLLLDMVSLAVWHLQVRARQDTSASAGGCSFVNCLHIGEPCFAIGMTGNMIACGAERVTRRESQGTSKGRLLDFLHNSRAHSFLLPLLIFL
jgi:hypothetical protein